MALIGRNMFSVKSAFINANKIQQIKVANRFVRSFNTTMSRFERDKTKKDRADITMAQVTEKLKALLGVQPGLKCSSDAKDHYFDMLPKTQEELEPRSMQDSYTTALIPLSTDLKLQDKYVTFLNSLRVGRLLEDMDMFAVWVALRHIKLPKQETGDFSPYTLATALVDKIDFEEFKPLPTEDVLLSGHASWVGKSSMEIVVWLEQMHNGKWEKITRALFVMAARDPCNKTAAIVNPIKPANPEEEKILSGGEGRKKNRLQVKHRSLRKVIPDNEEQKLIHSLFTRTMAFGDLSFSTRALPTGCSWMEDCTMSNIMFCHPEQRNLHNKVFGGFIMRKALEFGWILTYLFCKSRPRIKHISDINFHKPVDVNSFVRMTSQIVYTQANYVQVSLYAEMHNALTGEKSTTNEFHLTFKAANTPPAVFPKTYQEAMMYLDGRRHFLAAVTEDASLEMDLHLRFPNHPNFE